MFQVITRSSGGKGSSLENAQRTITVQNRKLSEISLFQPPSGKIRAQIPPGNQSRSVRVW
ncbi:MAG: hypothetical protein WBA92_01935 [Pseudorhodobacter sp.]